MIEFEQLETNQFWDYFFSFVKASQIFPCSTDEFASRNRPVLKGPSTDGPIFLVAAADLLLLFVSLADLRPNARGLVVVPLLLRLVVVVVVLVVRVLAVLVVVMVDRRLLVLPVRT